MALLALSFVRSKAPASTSARSTAGETPAFPAISEDVIGATATASARLRWGVVRKFAGCRGFFCRSKRRSPANADGTLIAIFSVNPKEAME